jgi:hypothetical protein
VRVVSCIRGFVGDDFRRGQRSYGYPIGSLLRFGCTRGENQAEQIPEINEMVANPPEWLRFWSRQIGAELEDGLREAPGYIAFAPESGTIYQTYTVTAPDPFVGPYFELLLDAMPKLQPAEPHNYRKDEYPG